MRPASTRKGVVYPCQTHVAETKMSSVHTNKMCTLVRQAVKKFPKLGGHICLWGDPKYCV